MIVLIIGAIPTKVTAQTSYIGEIQIFAGNFAPKNWMICEGQLLEIDNYMSLFSVIGITYGGDGKSTFALPDLRGRFAVGTGTGISYSYPYRLSPVSLGEKIGIGTEIATISNNRLAPQHVHGLDNVIEIDISTLSGEYNNNDETKKVLVLSPTANGNTAIATTKTGKSEPFSLKPPTIAINYIICVGGYGTIYPSRQ